MSENIDLSDVVADATEHVERRSAAAEEAAEAAKPKASSTRLVVLSVLFAAVLVWDVYVLTRPPEGLPVVEQEVDLGWLVVGAVDLIESYRTDAGVLPSTTDLVDLLDEEMSYTPRQGGYVVVAQTEEARVEYDSDIPIDDWLTERGLDSDGGGGS